MSLYFNSSKSKCDLGDTIVKTKFDEDCKSLLSNSLETLIIPNDAEEINIDWSNMTSIKTLKFEEPYKLDYVGGFDYFTSLETVYIPDSVTKLGNPEIISDDWGGEYVTPNGFSNSGVKTVVIGENSQLKTISNSCFNYCTSLQSITLPNSVTSIEDKCFQYCSALSEITIPNSVTSLGNNCFDSCSSLQSIDIPNSVTSIGSSCFAGDGYTDNGVGFNVTFEEPCQMTYIPNSCFYGQLQLKSFTIPSSVKSLRSNCFQVTGLQSITIPNTVQTMTEIEIVESWMGPKEQESNWQFAGCENLTEVIFEEPCQIKKLPDYCFSACKLLTEITIPSSVEEIGEECFASHWESTEPITITINKPEDSITGAPWGATNATIIWNG